MHPDILPALIGGVVGVGGSVAAFIIQRWLKRRGKIQFEVLDKHFALTEKYVPEEGTTVKSIGDSTRLEFKISLIISNTSEYPRTLAFRHACFSKESPTRKRGSLHVKQPLLDVNSIDIADDMGTIYTAIRLPEKSFVRHTLSGQARPTYGRYDKCFFEWDHLHICFIMNPNENYDFVLKVSEDDPAKPQLTDEWTFSHRLIAEIQSQNPS